MREDSRFDSDAILQDLDNAPFSVMEFFRDVNDELFAFETLYLEITNEHAPIKQFYVRGNQVPFMNEQCAKPFGIETSCGKSSLMIALMLITPLTKKKGINVLR